MSSATITLIGFYDYDHTLFDGLNLPADIEKDLLIDTILMRGGEYEVVYSNPDLLKMMIGSWSKRWKPVFENWQRATIGMDEIRPLDNYDRHESWTDEGEHHDTNSSNSKDTMRGNGSTSGSDSTSASASASGTDTISAYDSNTLVNNTGTSQSNSSSLSSETGTESTTNTESNASNNGKSDGTTKATHTAHIYGNIGVTTSAAMFREFYDILFKYGNIYESIATVFLQAFVIPIL